MSEHSNIQTCCVTGAPICRRIFNMNLALGYTEEFYSLKALAELHSQSMKEIFDFAYDYVEARECFRKEWVKMKLIEECPLPNDCQAAKCFPND